MKWFGLGVVELDDPMIEDLDVPASAGVFVIEVESGWMEQLLAPVNSVAALIAVLALGALAVLARGVDVTVFEHAEWQRQAVRQQQKVIEVPGSRGSIRTSDGYVLATSVDRVAIQVDTKVLEYPEIFVRAAAPLLNASEEDCEKRITSGRRSVWLAKRVRPDVADQVRELAPQAVVLVPDFARIYPQGSLAAPVVGFVGREELNTVGRAGFEHSFDAVLAGEPEEYLAVNDAIQRKVRLERLHRGRAGHDLELLIGHAQKARQVMLKRADLVAQADELVVTWLPRPSIPLR